MYTNKIRYNLYETDINTIEMLLANRSNVFEYTINGNRMLGSLISYNLWEISTNLIIPYELRNNDSMCDTTENNDDITIYTNVYGLDLSEEFIDEMVEYNKAFNESKIEKTQEVLDEVVAIYVKHGYDIPGLTSELPDDINFNIYFKEAVTIDSLYATLVSAATCRRPDRGIPKAIAVGKATDIERPHNKFNKLIYNREELIDSTLRFSHCGYIINEDGTLGDLVFGFRVRLDILSANIIYYPDLKIDKLKPKQELIYQTIDELRGVDLFKRDHATMVVDKQYLIGMKSKYKGLEESGDFIFTRDSTIHTGLLWSYLLQSKSPLEKEGYRRHMIDDLINNHEDHILFGELTDGIHIMEVEEHYTKANGLDNMTKEEILQYFKNIIGEKEQFRLNVCIKKNQNLNKYGEYMVIETVSDKLIVKKEMI